MGRGPFVSFFFSRIYYLVICGFTRHTRCPDAFQRLASERSRFFLPAELRGPTKTEEKKHGLHACMTA